MNNDLISREALKKAIEKAFEEANLSEYEACVCVCEIYDKQIDNAPTVELNESVIQEVLNKRCMTAVTNEYLIALHGKRPQGEWIDHSEDGYVECPFCEHLTTCEDNIDELHYCWNCGAKMRKGGAKMRKGGVEE